MRLSRPVPARSLISLVSMIDVLMIMLVFFMVTSTYLDLDMIPVAERGEAEAPEAVIPDGLNAGNLAAGATVLIRLAADGRSYLGGQAVAAEALRARLAADPEISVVVLPSGQAQTQALVALLDLAAEAGVTRLRLLRLEAQP